MIFSGGSNDLAENQEEEWRSEFFNKAEVDSNKTLLEESKRNLIKSNDTDLISLSNTSVKTCGMVQGAAEGDVVRFEREVKDMMEAVKKLQKTLSQGVRIDEIFRVEASGEESAEKTMNTEENMKASFQEIEKMDAILRVKAAEERQAKLCRIQSEEESRDILSRLPRVELSSGVKVNVMEFIRLLNDTEEVDCDSSCPQNLKRVDEVADKGKNQDNSQGKMKTEKKIGEHRKSKNSKFIEKNIQLAKCGRGTLSVTDEEKRRIEELLSEADDGASIASLDCFKKDLYGIDDETKSLLSKIDRRLETVAQRVQRPGRFRITQGLLEKLASEETVCEKVGKNDAEGGDVGKKKKSHRLAKIDQLLNLINSVCHEEITPLSEELIESLLEDSRREERLLEERGLRKEDGWEEGVEKRRKEEENAERGEAVNHDLKGPEDFMCELVSNAKLLMPKFKYRFDETNEKYEKKEKIKAEAVLSNEEIIRVNFY